MKLPQLSKPAILASISYLVLAFMILLPFNSYKLDPEQPATKQTFGYRLLVLFIMLIPFGLSIYSINCMMVGKCVVWSYVQAIAIAVWVMLFVFATLISTESQREVVLL
jgi:hypothetical protein